MTIEEAIEELEETWAFTVEELDHIRDLMEQILETQVRFD